MKKIILLVLACFIFFSCAVQKRKYQKGYHISWHGSSATRQKEKAGLAAEARQPAQAAVPETRAERAPQQEDAGLQASGDKHAPPPVRKTTGPQPEQADEPC